MVENKGIVEVLQTSTPQEIEAFCNVRFQNNLGFFKEYYPKLFDILKNEAKEFQLYIGDEGVNIYNFVENYFLFPVNDGKSAMLEIHQNCAYNPPINERWNRIYGTRAVKMSDDFPFSNVLVNGILDFSSKNGAFDGYHLPSGFLPSLSLFGLGGGIFLQILAENYDLINNFFIFEESLDLFRIACFFVDFPLLFSKTPHRAGYIFLESLVGRNYISDFFALRKISNCAVRFEFVFYQSEKNQNAKDLVAEMHGQTLRGWGTFEDEMVGIKNKLSIEIKNMLIEPKRVNAPICVVANGASLDSLLPFIKKNQNKMIIFSCGTALKPLLNAKIKPDFQIEIERHHYLDSALKEAPLGDVALLCASVISKEAKEVAKELYVFERDGSSAANLNEPKFKVKFTAPLVGNAGASLAAYLGSDVLLCGVDCGYKEGSSKHAKNSYYGDEKAEIPKDAYRVVGNFSDDIYSDSLFSLSRSALEEAFRMLKPFNILNLSDGAMITGAKPIRYQDFELKNIDKKKCLEQIKSLFRDPKAEGFYKKDSSLYIFELLAFKNRISDLFSIDVKGKRELFKVVDKIYSEIGEVGKENAFIGILFGGTLSHFLYATILAALHLPHNDMEELWKEARRLYLDGIDKMITHTREVILKVEQ